jgi:mxaA protein
MSVSRKLFPAALLALHIGAVSAQAGSVDLRAGRPFGYFLGDEIPLEAEVSWEERYALSVASVPQPGSVTYWLDLKAVQITQVGAGHYRLQLLYQTFYAPLGPQMLKIPGFTLIAMNGEARSEARVPAWQFLMSPLRDIDPHRSGDAVAIRGDVPPSSISLVPYIAAVAGFASAALLVVSAIAWHWALWPFRRRAQRPFAYALRSMRGADYASRLLQLHRAFDAVAGRRLLAEDVDRFIESAPTFRELATEIAAFFSASRQTFFETDLQGAMAALSLDQLRMLGEQLAAAERQST